MTFYLPWPVWHYRDCSDNILIPLTLFLLMLTIHWQVWYHWWHSLTRQLIRLFRPVLVDYSWRRHCVHWYHCCDIYCRLWYVVVSSGTFHCWPCGCCSLLFRAYYCVDDRFYPINACILVPLGHCLLPCCFVTTPWTVVHDHYWPCRGRYWQTCSGYRLLKLLLAVIRRWFVCCRRYLMPTLTRVWCVKRCQWPICYLTNAGDALLNVGVVVVNICCCHWRLLWRYTCWPGIWPDDCWYWWRRWHYRIVIWAANRHWWRYDPIAIERWRRWRATMVTIYPVILFWAVTLPLTLLPLNDPCFHWCCWVDDIVEHLPAWTIVGEQLLLLMPLFVILPVTITPPVPNCWRIAVDVLLLFIEYVVPLFCHCC